MSFNSLGLSDALLKAISKKGYTTPSPIQQKAIPPILEGKDVLASAQTGTGKTAGFTLPILQILSQGKHLSHRPIRALILTPTRELAAQILANIKEYSEFVDLRSTVIFGGVNQNPQVAQLRHGVDILVATPGRLIDLQNQGLVTLSKVEILVLDEADRMLDMGFIHDVKKVIAKLPAKRQTLFFSATMPPEIQKLADVLLKHPAKVEVTPPSSTVDKIAQQLYFVAKKEKPELLIHLLADPEIKTTLVFTRTKHGADKVVKILQKFQIRAAAIHGNKSQNARQNALADFKNGTIRVLVATDIAARGIDIDELSHVINFDLPDVPETYVHRIGRTGRAGNEGIAISFCSADEKEELRDIQKLIGKQIPVVAEHPFTANAHMTAPAPEERPARPNFRGQQGDKRQGNNRGNSGNNSRPAQRQQPARASNTHSPARQSSSQHQAPKHQTSKPQTTQAQASSNRQTLEQWEEAERW